MSPSTCYLRLWLADLSLLDGDWLTVIGSTHPLSNPSHLHPLSCLTSSTILIVYTKLSYLLFSKSTLKVMSIHTCWSCSSCCCWRPLPAVQVLREADRGWPASLGAGRDRPVGWHCTILVQVFVLDEALSTLSVPSVHWVYLYSWCTAVVLVEHFTLLVLVLLLFGAMFFYIYCAVVLFPW